MRRAAVGHRGGAEGTRSAQCSGVIDIHVGDLALAELITHRIPFARAADAYALLDGRDSETVQVVLDYA